MNFDFLNPNTNYQGSSFMQQGRGVQSPADFLKALQGFTHMTPMGATGGAAPGDIYGAGSGWGNPQDVLSKSFLANEGAGATPGGGGFDFSAFSRLLTGGKNADGTTDFGLGSTLVGGASALGSLYTGMKQFGLAKDQLSFAKDSFAKNWEAQKTTTNSQLEDRQAARVASNSNAYQSVGDYMKKNGVKG